MRVVWPKYLKKTKENRNNVELQKEEPELELLQNDSIVHYAYVYPV